MAAVHDPTRPGLAPPAKMTVRTRSRSGATQLHWRETSPKHVEFRRTGDRRLRDELVAAHIGLAHKLATRFANRGEPTDDLVQVAVVGLLHAVDRFDPDRGVDFVSFAAPTILGELKRHFRDRDWSVRPSRQVHDLFLRSSSATDELIQELGRMPTDAEVASRTGSSVDQVREAHQAGRLRRLASLDAPVNEDGGRSPADVVGADDSRFSEVEQRLTAEELLERLSGRERELVRLRFLEGLTQSEIGARLDISQVQVSRLLARSLGRLRTLAHA